MNHPLEPCQCHGKSVCSACAYYIALYRRKRAIKAILRGITGAVLTAALISGTMAATRANGLVLKNTVNVAVASPTESGLLSRPNLTVYGRDASIRKVGGVATFTFLTSRPPNARKNANGGYQSHVGA
jgi:hypothetical protein